MVYFDRFKIVSGKTLLGLLAPGVAMPGAACLANTARPCQAFPRHGQMKAEQAETIALRKEVAKLKMERDILREAAAWFAKEST